MSDESPSNGVSRHLSDAGSGLMAAEALGLLGDVYYEWDIGTDALVWAPHACQVLGFHDASRIATGRRFAARSLSRKGTSRYEIIHRSGAVDDGRGVPYCIEYQLTKGDDSSCWIEDRGRWFADIEGTPARAIGVIRIITERREREEQLIYLSSYDDLTGHLNRSRVLDLLSEVLDNTYDTQSEAAYLLIAIDHLSVINHSFGFDIADEVIVEVGNRVERVLRFGDAIGRMSGNKFGVVLRNCTEKQMHEAAERFLAEIRQSVVETRSGPVSVTVSVGCVALRQGIETVEQIMTGAEEALAEAKLSGRNVCIAFKPSEERTHRRLQNIAMADRIVSALNDRRVRLALQPIVDATTGEPVLYEALLRLVDTNGAVISAQDFVPISERLGLIRLLDHRAMELAIEKLAENPDISLSLNVSGYTTGDKAWLDTLEAVLGSAPAIARRLVVEITETIAIHDVEEMARFVSRIRNLGCRVAIDDFGAGYTSFRNLRMLNVDMVKIDGSFIEGIAHNPANVMFVRTFIDLARNFSIPIVAEWVTTPQDAALLRELGVQYLQGFHFGAPEMDQPVKECGPAVAQRLAR